MNWSARVSFFVIASFMVYVYAMGDAKTWVTIFSKPVAASGTTSATQPKGLTPLQPIPAIPVLPQLNGIIK